MSEFDQAALRRAFGSFMTGVTVVTARSQSGDVVGFTANSFTSVSLAPPLLLVCPGKHLNSFGVFACATHFAVNILAEGQELESNTFARSSDDRFSAIPWHVDAHGSPLIDGCAASFSCRAHQRCDAGDHMVLIGEVLSFECSKRNGLGYCLNGYFSLSQEQDSNTPSKVNHTGVAGAIIEHADHVLVIEGKHGYELPCVVQNVDSGARLMLQQYLDSLGLAVSLGPVYSVYDDAEKRTQFTFFRARAESQRNCGIGSYQPIASFEAEQFSDPAVATMVVRFISEHRNQLFGLFLGNAGAGEVHVTSHERD